MPMFDKFRTGRINPESGLYLCDGCGEIIPLSKDERFPPCETCNSATWMMVAVAGQAGRKYRTATKSPESGLFLCTSCEKQIIPIAKGNTLPPCASCRRGTEWQIIVYA